MRSARAIPRSRHRLRFVRQPQQPRDFRRLHLHQVEQRIQADRSVVDDIHAERTEAIRRIEAGLPHRPVALVEQRRESIGLSVVILRDIVIRDLVGSEIFFHQLVMGAALRVALRRDHFGSGTFAHIEIAGKTGFGDQVRFAGPVAIVFLYRRKRIAQPP